MNALARLQQNEERAVIKSPNCIGKCLKWSDTKRFLPGGMHPCLFPAQQYEMMTGKPTKEFNLKLVENSCKDKDAKHRSKMPYIQYSAKQEKMQLQAEQNSKLFMVPVPSHDSDDKITEKDDKLITIDALARLPKCPWKQPCDIAFGSMSSRFARLSKSCTGGNPPPGTYDPYDDLKAPPQGAEPFSLSSSVNRRLKPKDGVGPACYRFKGAVEKHLEELEKRTKPFDSLVEPLCGLPKHGFYAFDKTIDCPWYNIDQMSIQQTIARTGNALKGKFLKADRFRKLIGQRICLGNELFSRVAKTNQVGPATYCNELPKFSYCKLKASNAAFGSKCKARGSEKAYNENIGNLMPFTCPGRYEPFRYEKGKNNLYAGISKATGRVFDPKEHTFSKERNRAQNTIKKTNNECCFTVDVSSHFRLQ